MFCNIVHKKQDFSFNYNPLHNNLEFYKVLVHVPFTTSNTELNMCHNKPYIRVADFAQILTFSQNITHEGSFATVIKYYT